MEEDMDTPKKAANVTKSSDEVMKAGQAARAPGNLYHRMKEGFHAAFPEDEHPTVTKQKAKEAQKHFRNFMVERGGHAMKNQANITSENGKTTLSKGAGRHTIGLALTPHNSAGLGTFNTCPKASTECKKNCLGFTAGGNKQYPETAFKAKLLRTQYMTEHPEHAARLVSHELGMHEKKAAKAGYQSGFRGNVTSDLPYEHLMPKKFFEKHAKTQFYDYTKLASRVDHKDLPKNYKLALSHTGTGHAESNDKDAIKTLDKGGVVAMVYHRGKNVPHPTHVEDVSSGKRYPIHDGDSDDNVDDRPKGSVSGLKLKGVTNEKAGHFANKVDPDGVIRINHPKTK